MAHKIRALAAEEFGAFLSTVLHTFGMDFDSDSKAHQRLLKTLDPARSYGVFSGTELVGTGGAFDLNLSIPGGEIPMAGLTLVTVCSPHRRQGILRSLIDHHLLDAREHGESISGLWASEASIYGRFGYGVAAECEHLELDCTHLVMREPGPGHQIRLISPGKRAYELLAPIYERARRPGMLVRSEAWWKERWLYDGEERRQGTSQMRIAIAELAGTPMGYVAYRQRQTPRIHDSRDGNCVHDRLSSKGRALRHFVHGLLGR